ncbi:hypothetical protein GW931_03520 [archaeon]|nr:hypothetical protein [archaeon]PJC45389.1 MAG: hypothetical protein CO037_01730 [Candidatus Pacearchaeota archaeon CG_4_9_14_0_2_um_filter_30_8]
MGILDYEVISSFSPLLYALLGGIFGDSFMILVGFLYSQGEIPLLEPIIFTLIGLVLADCIFYFIGASSYFSKLKKTKIGGKILKKTNSAIDFLTGNNLVVALFYCKFITGAKFIINVYLGERKIPFKRYFTLNLVMAIFWTVVSWSVGYLSGAGFSWIWEYFESLALASFFIIVIIGIIYTFSKKLKRHFKREYH